MGAHTGIAPSDIPEEVRNEEYDLRMTIPIFYYLLCLVSTKTEENQIEFSYQGSLRRGQAPLVTMTPPDQGEEDRLIIAF